MIENNVKRESGTRPETGEESTAQPRPHAAGAPWWLVIVLVFGLVGMAIYIAWMNSATIKNRMEYVSGFLGSRKPEAELLSPIPNADSVAAWEKLLLNAGTLAPDSGAQGWKSGPEPTQISTGSEPNQKPPPVSDFNRRPRLPLLLLQLSQGTTSRPVNSRTDARPSRALKSYGRAITGVRS